MTADRKSSVSKASNYEAMGEFWDTHDFTDYDDESLPDIDFDITVAVAIESELLSAVEREARSRGVSVETLVNLWLQEKLIQYKNPVSA